VDENEEEGCKGYKKLNLFRAPPLDYKEKD
jgi:hypothetical protein